ncbi:MAG: NAD-dependent deacylase [Azospirillaceae bacterium]
MHAIDWQEIVRDIALAADDGNVVLTGAGISKESGLDTFRDPDGIWARHAIEEVATPEAFARDPGLVHAFYNARRRQLETSDIRPNQAHEALARLDTAWPGPFLLVTQNVDDLHDRVGSRRLVHMHGALAEIVCQECRDVRRHEGDLTTALACQACGVAGGLRPNVVWFGEMPYRMAEIGAALDACRLFVSIGTSGTVYPAAGFVREARLAGARCLELNLEATDGSGLFHRSLQGPATDLVPAFVAALLDATGRA